MTALIALTWLRRLAASIPWFGYIIAGMAVALVLTAHSARREHRRAVVAETSLASVAATQRAVNRAAVLSKATKEAAAIVVTKETDHASDIALAGVRADYAALRLRYATLARHPGPGAMPGVPQGPAGVDCPATASAARPSPELIDFAEQGDVLRQRLADTKDWYDRQAAVDRTPQP